MGIANRRSQILYSRAAYNERPSFNEDQAAHLSIVPYISNLNSWRYRGVKRAIDLVCAVLMIIACLVPGVLIAIAILLTMKGPIFYREVRIGRNGRPFQIWKFRSMSPKTSHHPEVETVPHRETLSRWRTHKDAPDPRITAVGLFLRRWSLDEIPQLINVLRGEMSLVGPRPVVRAELPLYKNLEGFYLAATPGLSGLWQVSGRSNVSFTTRAQLDASYVRSWSVTQDIVILAKTIPAVLRRVGAR